MDPSGLGRLPSDLLAREWIPHRNPAGSHLVRACGAKQGGILGSLEAAIRAVSTHTRAVGWYALGDRRPVAEQRLPCTWESISRHGQLGDIVHLPSGERVVCGLVVVREEGGSYE